MLVINITMIWLNCTTVVQGQRQQVVAAASATALLCLACDDKKQDGDSGEAKNQFNNSQAAVDFCQKVAASETAVAVH